MNPKNFPSLSAALLVAAAYPVVAQDVSLSTADSGAGGSSSSLMASALTETAQDNASGYSSSDLGVSSFFFPGGYGYLPETIAPGAMSIGRSPVSFSLSLSQGYDDNIYSASNASGVPKKGSATTQLSAGVDVLFSGSRSYLATQGSIGGVYYWEKDGGGISPVGNLNLAYAYNFTPRLHLAARINGGYYVQPDLSLPNAPTRPNSGDYFNMGSLFDLSYQWTPLFATNTTFGVNGQVFKESEAESGNYVELLVGESFRYKFAARFTGVLEVRASRFWYNDSSIDSTTQSILAGVDAQLNARLNGSLRAGVSFRQYELEGAESSSTPYVESILGYRYGRGSIIQWSNRYGFEEAGFTNSRYQTYRTSVLLNHALTARLNFTCGVSYAYQVNETLLNDNFPDTEQHLISGNVGLQYVFNRNLALTVGYSRNQIISDEAGGSYYRNQYNLGVTYQF